MKQTILGMLALGLSFSSTLAADTLCEEAGANWFRVMAESSEEAFNQALTQAASDAERALMQKQYQDETLGEMEIMAENIKMNCLKTLPQSKNLYECYSRINDPKRLADCR